MIVDDTELGDYCEAPKYDEAPGEEEVDWQGQDMILAALGLKDNNHHPPLQLKGEFINTPVKILIDEGSSLNWLSLKLGREMQLDITEEPITVSMANGDTITSSLKCNDFKWKCNGHTFTTQVWLMDLKDWDAILGVEWLSQLGNLHCNYSEQSMQFSWDGQQVLITSESLVEFLGAIHQMSEAVPLWMEQLIHSYEGDSEVEGIMDATVVDQTRPQEYYLQQGLLQYRGKWVVKKSGN